MSEEPDDKYDRRIVGFSDILGWRAHIADTVLDPTRLKWLRAIAKGWSDTAKFDYSGDDADVLVTTFSDNIVMSQQPKQPRSLLARMAVMQVNAAAGGFWVRGGATIGEVIHTGEYVFGPALNRAYEIETTVAKYPRIVVDPVLVHEFGPIGEPVTFENGEYFLDPFTPKFLSALRNVSVSVVAVGGLEKYLSTLSARLSAEIKKGLPEKELGKVLWLYFRLAINFKDTEYSRMFPGLDVLEQFKTK